MKLDDDELTGEKKSFGGVEERADWTNGLSARLGCASVRLLRNPCWKNGSSAA